MNHFFVIYNCKQYLIGLMLYSVIDPHLYSAKCYSYAAAAQFMPTTLASLLLIIRLC